MRAADRKEVVRAASGGDESNEGTAGGSEEPEAEAAADNGT